MPTEEKDLLPAILITVIIFAVILALFIYSIVRQHSRYRQLALAKIKAEINTLEQERQRLASDLHDEVGPLLSAVKIQINHLEAISDSDQQLVQKSSVYIDDVIKKIREICNGLLPNLLIRKGLIAAVEDFLDRLKGNTSMSISFDHRLNTRLPQGLEVNLYRIVLEIVHNAMKHAEADSLRLQLASTPNGVRLAAEDNGRGFDMNKAVQAAGGHGLLNLQSRAEVMGAEFTFDSKPGAGTRYLFEIPIP